MAKTNFALMLLFIFFIPIGFAHADADLAIAGSAQCDEKAFYDSLGKSESGGCGGGNQYNCTGPTITSGMHKGDKPLGKYQFMPKTLKELGISQVGFVGNEAAQEEAIRKFTARNNSCLDKPYTKNGVTYPPASSAIGTKINGVKITRSGLLGASHLSGCGGARKFVRTKSSGSSDQLGTSALGYAGKFQDYGVFGDPAGITCGGGVPNAADSFAQSQAEGLHKLIGCNEDILKGNEAMTKAMNERDMQIAKTRIAKPTDIAVMTCADQTAEQLSNVGGVHANPQGGNVSDTLGPLVMEPLKKSLTKLGEGNPLGSLGSMAMNSYAEITAEFNKALGSLTGGLGGLGGVGGVGGATDCGMTDQIFDMAKCLQTPQIPSLNDMLNGVLDTAGGTVKDAINAPFDALNSVCEGVSDQLGGYMNDATSVFENAADSISAPITGVSDGINNAVNGIGL